MSLEDTATPLSVQGTVMCQCPGGEPFRATAIGIDGTTLLLVPQPASCLIDPEDVCRALNAAFFGAPEPTDLPLPVGTYDKNGNFVDLRGGLDTYKSVLDRTGVPVLDSLVRDVAERFKKEVMR